MPSLDIIIVNWNAGQQIYNCLKSIAATSNNGYNLQRVVVVDNDSVDRSLDVLENIRLPLMIIRNATNLGFAAACNQGAACSKADYLLFLNPDTKLFHDSIVNPIAFMQDIENKSIGICGIQLMDGEANITRSCSRFPTAFAILSRMIGFHKLFILPIFDYRMSNWGHSNSQEVDLVLGAFFLVRHSLFKKLGGFDERFFVYFEEVDFSYRAFQAGFRSYYLSTATAYHKGGGTTERVKATRLYYSTRSRILYCYKHFDKIRATGVLVGSILIEPLSRIMLACLQRSWKGFVEIIKGYAMLLRSMPEFLSKVVNR